MAGRDPVLQYAGLAKEAERETGIPAAALLGLTFVESRGNIHAVSPAGAFGLTQFMPATAQAYGVRDGDARSQMFGAARYLKALGFDRDPITALRKYNGGTNGPNIGETLTYARNVMTAASRYGNAKPTSSSTSADDFAGVPTTTTSADTTGGGDVLEKWGDKALHATVWVALAAAGAAFVILGSARATGVRQPHGAVA